MPVVTRSQSKQIINDIFINDTSDQKYPSYKTFLRFYLNELKKLKAERESTNKYTLEGKLKYRDLFFRQLNLVTIIFKESCDKIPIICEQEKNIKFKTSWNRFLKIFHKKIQELCLDIPYLAKELTNLNCKLSNKDNLIVQTCLEQLQKAEKMVTCCLCTYNEIKELQVITKNEANGSTHTRFLYINDIV